jgi:hypothetical protein
MSVETGGGGEAHHSAIKLEERNRETDCGADRSLRHVEVEEEEDSCPTHIKTAKTLALRYRRRFSPVPMT